MLYMVDQFLDVFDRASDDFAYLSGNTLCILCLNVCTDSKMPTLSNTQYIMFEVKSIQKNIYHLGQTHLRVKLM